MIKIIIAALALSVLAAFGGESRSTLPPVQPDAEAVESVPAASAAPAVGTWTKYLNGRVTIAVLPKSTYAVGVSGPQGSTSIAPGYHVQGWQVNGSYTFSSCGAFESASDVPGGVDIKFTNTWVTVRHCP